MTDLLSREAVAIADQCAAMRAEADALEFQAKHTARTVHPVFSTEIMIKASSLRANADRLERKGAQT